MSDTPSGNQTGAALLRLEESDRTRLGEALRALLNHGSILGGEGSHRELYHWCVQTKPWLEEMAALFELQLFWETESRLVQAVPCSPDFLLRLKLDATLVLLTLWYEFDSAVRERGETPPIVLTAESLNTELETKFSALQNVRPSPTRLLEILRLAQRKNLVRFARGPIPAQTRIEILPTIRKIIPFQNLDDWTRCADRFLAASQSEADELIEDDAEPQD